MALRAAGAMRSTARPRRVAEGRASSVAAKVDCRCDFGARRHRGDLLRRPSRTISELSSPWAREQSSRGTVNARSSQPQAAVDMLQPCSQAQVSQSCEHTGRDVHRPRAERLRYIVSSDWRFGSKVERARSAFVDNPRLSPRHRQRRGPAECTSADHAAEAAAPEPVAFSRRPTVRNAAARWPHAAE